MTSSEPDSCTTDILQPLRDLYKVEEDLLKYGRDAASASRDQFVNEKIGKFFGLAIAYRNCFERLKVKTKVECEKIIKDNFRQKHMREVFEDITEIEAQWDTFLEENDITLEGDIGDTVQLDDFGPMDATLHDARTGNSTSLHQFAGQDEICSMNGKVIIISFGLREGALKWMQETQCPFDMLLDAGRQVYHAFGLKRSVYKVWNVAAMVYYAERMMEGKPLPKPYENIHDDTQQMGGDFILDKEGRAKFLYPSKTSSDRPDVSVILDVLKKIQQ